MSKRIYVGNLPWSVTKEKFDGLFAPFGEIEEALVIANKYTGRSRGFGFVTYKNDKDADKAMAEMNEKDIEGRKLVVKVARPSREDQEGQVEEKKEETEEKGPVEEKEKLEEKPSKEKEETEEKAPKEKEKKPKKQKPEEEKEETEEEK